MTDPSDVNALPLPRFADDVTGVQSRIILVHQLRASADIQDRQTKEETGWADTNDRATLMRKAAAALERLSAANAAVGVRDAVARILHNRLYLVVTGHDDCRPWEDMPQSMRDGYLAVADEALAALNPIHEEPRDG